MDKVVFDRLSSFNFNHQQKRDLIDVIKHVSKDDNFEDTFILNIYEEESDNFIVKQEDVPDLCKALLDKKRIVGKIVTNTGLFINVISGNQFITVDNIDTYLFSVYFDFTVFDSIPRYLMVYGGMAPDIIDVYVNIRDVLTPEEVDIKFKEIENKINALKKVATTEANGLMSKEDKVKLDSIDTDTTNYLTLEFTGIMVDSNNAKMNIANAVLKNPPLYADVKKVIDNKGFVYLKYNVDGFDYHFTGAYVYHNERAIIFYIPNINIDIGYLYEQSGYNIVMQPIKCIIIPDKSPNPIVQCELQECSDVMVNQLLMVINPAIMYIDRNEDGFTTIWTKQTLKLQVDNGKRIYISPNPSSETIKKYPIYGFATSAKHGNNYYVTFNTIDKDSNPIQVVFYTTDDSTLLKVSVKGIATKEDIANEATAREQADKVLTDNLATEVNERTNAILLEAETRNGADVELSNKINAEVTTREQADMTINGEIQGIKDKGSLHDLFLACGATYNKDTKMYQLNGLDLTFEEMLICYKDSAYLYFATNWRYIAGYSKMRTNIPFKTYARWVGTNDLTQSFEGCNLLEVLDLYNIKQTHQTKVSACSSAFRSCSNLRVVKGLNLRTVTISQNAINTFFKCNKLETIEIFELGVDISFNDSPLLSKESIVHLISNATPTSAITITLHPTAYAMAIADPDIQAELEKQPNISLAEGEPSA